MSGNETFLSGHIYNSGSGDWFQKYGPYAVINKQSKSMHQSELFLHIDYSQTVVRRVCFCFQEAESARVNLFELKAVTAAVESSGQRKAEAQVSRMSGLMGAFSCRYVYLATMMSLSQNIKSLYCKLRVCSIDLIPE